MASFLDTIIHNKLKEQQALRLAFGQEVKGIWSSRKNVSMAEALRKSDTGIIAEFKRRSPSKGDIHPMASVSEIVPAYFTHGATAVSVLTDTRFFGGASLDLLMARELTQGPLLRKDFVVCERQIHEAKALGADAILLIAACTSKSKVREYTETAHSVGLEVLLEIHNEKELDCYFDGVDMVGVNNRDLTTFNVDTSLSVKVANYLPENVVKVAESGLTDFKEIAQLRKIGYRGFLIGETFMKVKHPALALEKFITGKE